VLGSLDGLDEGNALGSFDGIVEGCPDGCCDMLGCVDGAVLGTKRVVGMLEGKWDGAAL
jgi:hypothetical protein